MQVTHCHQPAFKITGLVKQQSSTTTNIQAQAVQELGRECSQAWGMHLLQLQATIISMQNGGTAGNGPFKA